MSDYSSQAARSWNYDKPRHGRKWNERFQDLYPRILAEEEENFEANELLEFGSDLEALTTSSKSVSELSANILATACREQQLAKHLLSLAV